MADVYTPTKTLDGTQFATPETPEPYVPTKINPATPTSTASNKHTDIRLKYGAQAGEAYSPSNPAIRIVKRKPKPTTDTESSSNQTTVLGKRSSPSEDAALSALKTQPKKGILRNGQQPEKRLNRRIVFADAHGLPLTAIKEIEKIAAIHHSSTDDFRNFDKNEGSAFCREVILDEPDWVLLHTQRSKPLRTTMSETGKREEQRVQDLGLLRGAMFGACSLEDDPILTDLAQRDFANSKPIPIPIYNVSKGLHDSSVMQTLRELPLPGRNRMGDVERHSSPHSYSQHNQYEDDNTVVYQGTMAAPEKPPVIQQIFQESDLTAETAYYASTESEQYTESKSSTTKFELPANLREMLSQLKKKGFVSEDSNPKPTTAPLVAAMQTAQQMYQNQQIQQNNYESYGSESGHQDFQGYIGNVMTSEMSSQELQQNTRNSEGWTQSGWKIQEACAFYINRPQGCNRGDQCRFLHDDAKRQQMLDNPHNRPTNGNRAGYQRDNDDRDRRFRNDRGGRRGTVRGGFRNNQQDREFRERRGFTTRFGNQAHSGFDLTPQEESYLPQNQPQRSENQLSPEYQQSSSVMTTNPSHSQQSSGQAGFSGYHAQMTAPLPQVASSESGSNKPARRSRFDQRDDTAAVATQDVDFRLPRRNRFDEGPPPTRSFRTSRFDERPRDQDDRNQAHQNKWMQPQ